MPKPCCYDKTKTLIISTDWSEFLCDPGIYQFNLETNKIELLIEYEDIFEPTSHDHFIDDTDDDDNDDNDVLYMYGVLKEIYANENIFVYN